MYKNNASLSQTLSQFKQTKIVFSDPACKALQRFQPKFYYFAQLHSQILCRHIVEVTLYKDLKFP